MNPANVPPELRPLIPLAQRWGAVCSNSERYEVADFADEDDARLTELTQFASRWTPLVNTAFDDWSDRTSLTESPEFCKFYFLLMMLDEMEIRISGEPRPDPVSRSQADLVRMTGIGAEAGRMHAARSLCECEADAREAVPDLERATADPSDNVRAWAHAALAVITGNVAPHRAAIEAIRKKPKLETGLTDFTDSALDELSKTSAARVTGRLCGAAITNDVATIRMLLSRGADPRAADHHGQTSLGYAVGNGHPGAARLLLAAGADPNQRDRSGVPLLHSAARRRDPALVELLLQYGADPHAKDPNGRTALNVAEVRRRTARAAALLRAAGG